MNGQIGGSRFWLSSKVKIIMLIIMLIIYSFNIIRKHLRIGYLPAFGRNFTGKICVRHQGGANKCKQFYIDFFRRQNAFGYLSKIQKSSNFTGYLGLILYLNGISNYILLSENLKIGDRIYCGSALDPDKLKFGLKQGSSLLLSYMPLFSLVSNIELVPLKGGQLARAAGTSAIIVTKVNNDFILKLKSGWNMRLKGSSMCTLGIISNSIHRFGRIAKAGINRALGIRPTVRGVAMNPCDHPHGGGEGRKSPLAAPCSPWGWLTKGTPSLITKKQLAKKAQYKKIKK